MINSKRNVVIKSVELVKSGTKNGKEWKLYKVTDENGLKYKGFNLTYQPGTVVDELVFEEEEKTFTGKEGNEITYTERMIKDSVSEPRQNSQKSDKFEQIMFKLDEILSGLEEIKREPKI